VPRNAHLSATAIWMAASGEARESVVQFALSLRAHDGSHIDFSRKGMPTLDDVRVRYKIFSLLFDLSDRAFDYAGRERPPRGLSPLELRSWVGTRPLPLKPLPGRQPATLVLTDGVAVHVVALVYEPTAPEPAEQAPVADEAALAEPTAGAPADEAADDARSHQTRAARVAALLAQCRDPNGELRVLTADEVHMLVELAGLRVVVGADPGPKGLTTYAEHPTVKGNAISVEISQRRRAHAVSKACDSACLAARRHVRTDEAGCGYCVEELESALGSEPSARELQPDRWRDGHAARSRVSARAANAVYEPLERRRERCRADTAARAEARAAAEEILAAHLVHGVFASYLPLPCAVACGLIYALLSKARRRSPEMP